MVILGLNIYLADDSSLPLMRRECVYVCVVVVLVLAVVVVVGVLATLSFENTLIWRRLQFRSSSLAEHLLVSSLPFRVIINFRCSVVVFTECRLK